MVVEVAIFTVKEGLEEEALKIFNEVKAMKEKQPGYKNAWVKKSVMKPRSYLITSEFDTWDEAGCYEAEGSGLYGRTPALALPRRRAHIRLL